MADKKTVGQLREYVDELMDLFQYFVFDEVESIDSDEQHDYSIIAVEFGRPDYNEFISYDYDDIYKKIDDVVDKIKGIDSGADSGSDSFILSDEETKRIIDNAVMTMFGRD